MEILLRVARPLREIFTLHDDVPNVCSLTYMMMNIKHAWNRMSSFSLGQDVTPQRLDSLAPQHSYPRADTARYRRSDKALHCSAFAVPDNEILLPALLWLSPATLSILRYLSSRPCADHSVPLVCLNVVWILSAESLDEIHKRQPWMQDPRFFTTVAVTVFYIHFNPQPDV